MSQVELAGQDLDDSYVSLIESGKRHPPERVIALLAERLGCTSEYLRTGVSSEHADRLRTTIGYAQIALENGEAAEACDHFARAVSDPALATLPELAYEARWGHAQALEAGGDLDDAIRELRAIAETISPRAMPDRWAHVHIAMCRCLTDCGEISESIRVGDAALGRLTDLGEPWRDATVMLGATLLSAHLYHGDLVYARYFAGRLVQCAEGNGTPRAKMAAYWNTAWVARLSDDLDQALNLAAKALALLGELNDPRNLARLRTAYGHFLLTAYPDQAEHVRGVLLQAQREVDASSASTVDAARCLIRLAQTELVLGRPPESAGLATRAVELLAGTAGISHADGLATLGDACLRLGRLDDAIAYLTEATRYLEKIGADRQAAQTWYDIAAIFATAGDQEGELSAIKHAMDCMNL